MMDGWIDYLFLPHLYLPLAQGLEVRNVEPVEESDGGDGGHGHDGQVVHHHVREHPLDVTPTRSFHGRHLLALHVPPARHEPHLGRHLLLARRTWRPVDVGHVAVVPVAAVVVVEVVVAGVRAGAAVVDLGGLGRRGAAAAQDVEGGRGGVGDEDGVAVVGGVHEVAVLELVEALAERGEAAGHVVLREQAGGVAEGHAEQPEEEVDEVLAGLGVEDLAGVLVDQELQLK